MYMYIKNDDYEYYESISNSLSINEMHDFLDHLFAVVKAQTGNDPSMLTVIDDRTPHVNEIKPEEIVIRSMIDVANRMAKEARDAK